MKKLLHLLFIFLSIVINAQINQNVTPYQLCNTTNPSQFGVFNLNNKTPEILGNLNPTFHVVAFYTTPNDALTNTNNIANTTVFTNTIPSFQDIYVGVTNTQTSEVEYTSFTLMISSANAGSDGNIIVCESSTIPIDLFSLIVGEQSGGIWTSVAGTGGVFNASAGIYTPGIAAATSIFTYTITGAPSCIDTSIATITITPQPNAGTDGTLTVCETSTTTLNLYSLLTGAQSGGTWARTSGSGGTFDAIAGTYIPSIGATTSAFTYTLFGIQPCINDSSVVTITINNCNNQTVCGGTFTDIGGAVNNYTNNSNLTTTICPTNPGESISVIFTSFDIEVNQDALYVYAGVNSIPSAQISSANGAANVPGSIAGGYWGTTIPGPFTSNSIEGCLTFVFRSDEVNTSGGWVANITCTPTIFVQCTTPSALASTNTTDTTVTFHWVQPANTDGSVATTWDVVVVPQGSPPPTDSSFGVFAQSNSFSITDLSPNGCYTAYVRALCNLSSEWSEPINFCMVNCENNAECAESLALVAFFDSNNNGTKESDEVDFNHGNFIYQLNDSGNNLYGTSNNGLYYIFDSNPTNSYDISFAVNTGLTAYYSSVVSHNNITLPVGSGATTLYFPIANPLPHVDAQINLSPIGQPRPGFQYINGITYRNLGSQTIASGTLNYSHQSNVSISSISQFGTTITANGFTYSFTNLAPFEIRYIQVELLVPTIPTVNLGDLVTNNATIQISSDIDLSNNSSSLTQTIVGSYDPNDKMESHGGKIVHSTFTSNDYLYYTVQFENTGTASAEFIRITDLLDVQLDVNSFEMITASHPVNTRREGNQLTWHFYNINLPPTSSDPTGSHGFVHFRIKPKTGYALGDIIPNTASIYFDYNPAIVTNQFDTEFVQALGNTSFSNNEFNLYPNPAKGIVHITQNSNQIIENIHFYDVTGKTIKSILNVNNFQTNIDISALAKGIYFVEITAENHIKQTKKLIIK